MNTDEKDDITRSSTVPENQENKVQKRYYQPITEPRVALCAISLAKNLLSLVMGCEFGKWDTNEKDDVTVRQTE